MFPIEATAAPLATYASSAFPTQESVTEPWSPYDFTHRSVRDADLDALFGAALWCASSRTEQPWTYLVANQSAQVEFGRLLSCLSPVNQSWARNAPMLVLSVINQRFSKNEEARLAMLLDLGLATAHLAMAAAARGLCVHQIISILPERARELYQIPAHFEAWTALAIGHQENIGQAPEAPQKRDVVLQPRRPTSEFVFSGSWGHASTAVVL